MSQSFFLFFVHVKSKRLPSGLSTINQCNCSVEFLHPHRCRHPGGNKNGTQTNSRWRQIKFTTISSLRVTFSAFFCYSIAGRYLKCVDTRGDTILLGLEQRGKFSALAREDNISGVHTARNLLSKRLPLTVRLVHGTAPRGLKSPSHFVPELRYEPLSCAKLSFLHFSFFPEEVSDWNSSSFSGYYQYLKRSTYLRCPFKRIPIVWQRYLWPRPSNCSEQEMRSSWGPCRSLVDWWTKLWFW